VRAHTHTGLDHVWSRLPESIKADYGEAHYKFQRALLVRFHWLHGDC